MAYRKVKNRTARRWTEAEIAQVRIFIEEGMSDKKVGKEVGRSEGAIQVFRRFGRPSKTGDFNKSGKKRKPRKKARTSARYTPNEIRKIQTMIAEGRTDRQIAKEVLRSIKAIGMFRRYGRPAKKADFRVDWSNDAPTVTPKQSKDKGTLVDLIFNSDITQDQKLTCLKALL